MLHVLLVSACSSTARRAETDLSPHALRGISAHSLSTSFGPVAIKGRASRSEAPGAEFIHNRSGRGSVSLVAEGREGGSICEGAFEHRRRLPGSLDVS